MNLGVALLNQRDLPGAIHEFETAVSLPPFGIEARINLAMAYAQSNRMDEAIEEYRRVLTVDPQNAVAQRMLKLAIDYRDHLTRQAATRASTTAPTTIDSWRTLLR